MNIDRLAAAIERKNVEPNGMVWVSGDGPRTASRVLLEPQMKRGRENLADNYLTMAELALLQDDADVETVRRCLLADAAATTKAQAIRSIQARIDDGVHYQRDLNLAIRIAEGK